MNSEYQKSRTSILIPMRSLNEGKTRLSNLLSLIKREKLIKLLFTQLLKKLKTLKSQSPLIFSDILVITPCEEVEKISKDFHVLVLKEQSLNGLNSAVKKGICWSSENLYDSSLILPGDIIDPETEDIKKILQMGKKSRNSMVICPSTDFGTNALFLSLPTRLNFKFGPNSFFEHQKEAKKISIRSIIAPVDSLKDDLDTGKDLEKFKTRQPKFFQSI
jgi:2-phospho-L-lactate guanylyltransferase